jgi:hypothetical protein
MTGQSSKLHTIISSAARYAGRNLGLKTGLLRTHYVSTVFDFAKLLILWWAQQDSNLRLPPCEGVGITDG